MFRKLLFQFHWVAAGSESGKVGGAGEDKKCPLYNLASRHKINKFHKKT